MKYTLIDLFGAPGGLSFGFKLAGFKVLGGIDIDKDGIKTYVFNFPEAVAIHGDLRKITAKELLEEIGAGKGDVDVVIGGPPCQGFSTVGRVKITHLAKNGVWKNINNTHPRFIDDPRNILYKEFVRIVSEIQPRMIVMENVPGMLSHRNGQTMREIEEDFKKIGYITEARVLNAVEYGVPQVRKRVFFIGVCEDDAAEEFMWPFPTHGDPENKDLENRTSEDRQNDRSFNLPVAVWDAIGDLPEAIPGKPKLSDMPLEYDKPPFSAYQKWAREGSKKIHNHIARQHTERDKLTFSLMNEGDEWKDLPQEIKKLYGYRDEVFKDKFKKLIKSRPSWTITAHLQKDGYRYIHPEQPRTITVREAARLQSFPDRFIFQGSRTSQFRQVGNAVPPLLARAVAIAVKAMLKGWGCDRLWREQTKIKI